jgi:hypothetical protein
MAKVEMFVLKFDSVLDKKYCSGGAPRINQIQRKATIFAADKTSIML